MASRCRPEEENPLKIVPEAADPSQKTLDGQYKCGRSLPTTPSTGPSCRYLDLKCPPVSIRMKRQHQLRNFSNRWYLESADQLLSTLINVMLISRWIDSGEIMLQEIGHRDFTRFLSTKRR